MPHNGVKTLHDISHLTPIRIHVVFLQIDGKHFSSIYKLYALCCKRNLFFFIFIVFQLMKQLFPSPYSRESMV